MLKGIGLDLSWFGYGAEEDIKEQSPDYYDPEAEFGREVVIDSPHARTPDQFSPVRMGRATPEQREEQKDPYGVAQQRDRQRRLDELLRARPEKRAQRLQQRQQQKRKLTATEQKRARLDRGEAFPMRREAEQEPRPVEAEEDQEDTDDQYQYHDRMRYPPRATVHRFTPFSKGLAPRPRPRAPPTTPVARARGAYARALAQAHSAQAQAELDHLRALDDTVGEIAEHFYPEYHRPVWPEDQTGEGEIGTSQEVITKDQLKLPDEISQRWAETDFQYIMNVPKGRIIQRGFPSDPRVVYSSPHNIRKYKEDIVDNRLDPLLRKRPYVIDSNTRLTDELMERERAQKEMALRSSPFGKKKKKKKKKKRKRK